MKKTLFAIALISLPVLMFSQNKFLFNPSVGFAWRTAEKPSGLTAAENDYLKQLTSGFHFDIGGYYMIKQDWGIGLKFNQYSASAEATLPIVMPDNSVQNLPVKTDDRITFVGPSIFGGNFSSETKHKYIAGISLGYLSYNSNTEGVEITGANLGLVADLGYQYQVSPKFSVGPQLGITAGTLTKIEVEGQTIELPEDSKEGLHRVSVSLGATIRL